MTRVTSRVETVERHIFTAPCDYSPGGDGHTTVIGDMLMAYSMAASAAKDLSIDTTFDDWANVRPRDEAVEIFFDVRRAQKKTEPPLWVEMRRAADVLDLVRSRNIGSAATWVEATDGLRQYADMLEREVAAKKKS